MASYVIFRSSPTGCIIAEKFNFSSAGESKVSQGIAAQRFVNHNAGATEEDAVWVRVEAVDMQQAVNEGEDLLIRAELGLHAA